MEELLVQATSGQGGRPARKHIRFVTLTVGIISGRANEIVEMLTRLEVDCRRQDGEEDQLV